MKTSLLRAIHPRAGSDATSITDSGVVCRGTWEGHETLGIRLNWDKRYITLAPVASVLGLAFRLYDPDHLLGDVSDIGITCALIPTHLPGVQIGRRHFPLNIPFRTDPRRGKDASCDQRGHRRTGDGGIRMEDK